jgi:Carboxypeptidase regulatory-like domain
MSIYRLRRRRDSVVRSSGGAHASWGRRRTGLALAALIACAVAFAAGPTAALASTGSIEGTVSNVGKAPLENIKVIASKEGLEQSVTTGAGGKYTIAGLEKGTYSVTFEDPKGEYVPLTKASEVKEGLTTTLNVELKKTGSIEGTVTNSHGGGALGGATVEGEESEEPFGFGFASTAGNGHYKLEHLPPGKYEVRFFRAGFLPAVTQAIVSEGAAAELNVALTEGGKITGTVTNSVSHAGVQHIGVRVRTSKGELVAFASTNSSGEYTVSGLESGSYILSFKWEFSLSEFKECEHAARCIPKYVFQFYNGQISEGSANQVSVTAGSTASGINVAMVPSAPNNTAAPTISGTPAAGSLLSCSPGSWEGESELKLVVGWPLTSPFSYQWLRDGAPVAGATSDGYLLQSADQGHSLTCEVTATNDAGHASARSSALAVPVPVPVVSSSASMLVVLKGATKVTISCAASAPCAGKVEAIEQAVIRHKKKTFVLGQGSYSVPAGARVTITLHLTPAGKKRLAAAKHHHTTAKLVITVTGGKQLEKRVGVSLAVHK